MRLPARLLRRRADSHKGDFGHILVLAGNIRFSGAALLACRSALRCGAGMVTLGVADILAKELNRIKPAEVMILPLPGTEEAGLSRLAYAKIKTFIRETADVLLLGPGMGKQRSTQELIRKIIAQTDRPMVIDADALNALALDLKMLSARRKKGFCKPVLTPHPGEMSRLSGYSARKIAGSRKEIAKNFAKYYNVILVLKGQRSIVADADGRIFVNATGNPGMASAGSGDVLSGMIAAFLGQGLKAFEAAKYGVYLHGLAGDLAAREKTQIGMIASDIIEKIPEAIKRRS